MEWIAFVAILIVSVVSHMWIKSDLEFKIKMLERDIDVLFKKSNATVELMEQKHEKMKDKLDEVLHEHSDKINHFSHSVIDVRKELNEITKQILTK